MWHHGISLKVCCVARVLPLERCAYLLDAALRADDPRSSAVDIRRIKHAVGVTPKALLRLVAIARSLSSAFWTRELSFRAHSQIDVNSLKIKGYTLQKDEIS